MASLDGFTIDGDLLPGRFAAACIGVATVWITYKLGAELVVAPVGAARSGAARGAADSRPRVALHPDRRADDGADDAGGLAGGARGAAGDVRAYAWAGAACGLAAAAKYNGGVALMAVAAAWFVDERTSPHRC